MTDTTTQPAAAQLDYRPRYIQETWHEILERMPFLERFDGVPYRLCAADMLNLADTKPGYVLVHVIIDPGHPAVFVFRRAAVVDTPHRLLQPGMVIGAAQAPAQAPTGRTTWLIELRPAFTDHPAFPPTYYTGVIIDGVAEKTTDHREACRFNHQMDAERVAKNLVGTLSCRWEAVEAPVPDLAALAWSA